MDEVIRVRGNAKLSAVVVPGPVACFPAPLGIQEQIADQIDERLDRLVGHPRPDYPVTDADRLDLANALLDAVDALARRGCFITPVAQAQARAPLLEAQERLQITLGLRPRPEPKSEPASEPAPVAHEVAPERDARVTADLPAPPEPRSHRLPALPPGPP